MKQEKSVNASLGFSFRPVNEFSITIDGFWVKIKDRVVLSGQFSADDYTLDPALLNALDNLNVGLAQFFANAVNTTNKGIDIVLDYNKRWGNKNFKALFTGNFQDMQLNKINAPSKLNTTKEHRETFLSEREQKFILASAPNTKFGFNFEYGINKFTSGIRLSYFGKVIILGYGDGEPTDFSPNFDRGDLYAYVPADSDSRPVKDEYNYKGKLVSDLRGWAFNNETGGPWDAVQMGGNGVRFFARLGFQF